MLLLTRLSAPRPAAPRPARPYVPRHGSGAQAPTVMAPGVMAPGVMAPGDLRQALAGGCDDAGRSRRLPGMYRHAMLLTGVAALLAVVLAGVCWAPHRKGAPTADRAGQPSSVGAVAEAALQHLDALRERAYASGDPSLLEPLYASQALLEQDAQLLRRLVPAGCGLVSAHTSYSHVLAQGASGGSLIITAEADLAASQVRCAGELRAAAPGSRVRLSITLAAAPGGYRIANQLAI